MIGELSLMAAIGIGAFHAMEPGHGKGILSAYIVSTHAKVWQAIILGVISSISHALSIFIIAYITTISIKTIAPGSLVHWIELLTSLLIIFIGFSRINKSLKPQIVTVKKWNGHSISHTDHEESHHHNHHFHVHHDKQPTTFLQFISVGFLTGIIPCPSALAIILAAVGSHQILIGIKLVVAFSIGGAFTMAILGYMVGKVSESVNKKEHASIIKITTILSSLLIIILGLLIFSISFKHLFI